MSPSQPSIDARGGCTGIFTADSFQLLARCRPINIFRFLNGSRAIDDGNPSAIFFLKDVAGRRTVVERFKCRLQRSQLMESIRRLLLSCNADRVTPPSTPTPPSALRPLIDTETSTNLFRFDFVYRSGNVARASLAALDGERARFLFNVVVAVAAFC